MQMDVGDAEALALAMELGDVVVMLNNKKACRVAEQIGLRITGTVEVLLRANYQSVIASKRREEP